MFRYFVILNEQGSPGESMGPSGDPESLAHDLVNKWEESIATMLRVGGPGFLAMATAKSAQGVVINADTAVSQIVVVSKALIFRGGFYWRAYLIIVEIVGDQVSWRLEKGAVNTWSRHWLYRLQALIFLLCTVGLGMAVTTTIRSNPFDATPIAPLVVGLVSFIPAIIFATWLSAFDGKSEARCETIDQTWWLLALKAATDAARAATEARTEHRLNPSIVDL